MSVRYSSVCCVRFCYEYLLLKKGGVAKLKKVCDALNFLLFAMFPIWGDNLFCAFLQGLTPPLHPAPGTTRSDVTLARECQRLGASGCFSAKFSFRPPAFLRNDETNLSPDFAIIGVLPCFAYAKHYTPNPSIFFSKN